jgi:N-terminal acetyltransferase B complex catalytic subunit
MDRNGACLLAACPTPTPPLPRPSEPNQHHFTHGTPRKQYGLGFYFNYLSRWPDMCCAAQHPNGRLMGYGKSLFFLVCCACACKGRPRAHLHLISARLVLGKAEGSPHDFHGHVTALSVAPEYRRLSLARILMNFLETASDDVYGGLFVDLYVRCTNSIAIDLYEGLGYSVYRRVREYYGSLGLGPGGKDEEDAFGSLPLSSRER